MVTTAASLIYANNMSAIDIEVLTEDALAKANRCSSHSSSLGPCQHLPGPSLPNIAIIMATLTHTMEVIARSGRQLRKLTPRLAVLGGTTNRA